MSEFVRDLRFAVRLLAKSPVFTVTAVLLLAIGIGANTLIFSLVDALLLRPLPVAHPENLVRLIEVHPNGFVTWDLPYDFCDAAASLDPDFTELLCQGETDVAFSDKTSTERVRVHLVSPNFFSSLGAHAFLGRVLTAEDERTKANNAVLSYGFWRRAMRGDPSILGRTIVLGGHPFTVVGVTPEPFNGLSSDTSPDLRVPIAVARSLVKPVDEINPAVTPLFAQIFARLRSGVPFTRANGEADPRMHAALEEESNRFFKPANGTARSNSVNRSRLELESIVYGVSTLRAQFSHSLEILMAGVALLLLMACANVAGLLLARSTARAREMGIRLALGASSGRIVRQLLTEGLLLSLIGGFAGILLTIACLPLLVRGLPPIRDRGAVLQSLAVHIGIDFPVLAFALGATVLTAALFALSPALRCSRADVASALKGGRTTTRGTRAGNLIVTAQVAICTLILITAALLVETLDRMRSMNPGFDRDRIVTFTIDPSLNGYTAPQVRAFSKTLLEKSRALPGVGSASIASRGLMRGTGVKATFGAAGSRITAADFLNSSLNDVTPDYFGTMGMRLLSGRAFNGFDQSNTTPHKVIVNQVFARRFFATKNSIGERFGFPGAGGIATGDNEIVGVVSDAKYRSLREPIPPTVYHPVVDGFESGFILHVRTRENPETMIAPIRELLDSLDPSLPIIEVRTLRQEVDASLWQERLLALLSTVFGAIAALLASIGLYGALDYALKSRTREIGVRMALGAEPQRIAGLFSQQAFVLTANGLALGLGAYAVAAVCIRRLLFDVRPWDPAAVIPAVLLVGFIAALATAPGTLRAMRIDPGSALRTETE
jgi:predicted permease